MTSKILEENCGLVSKFVTPKKTQGGVNFGRLSFNEDFQRRKSAGFTQHYQAVG